MTTDFFADLYEIRLDITDSFFTLPKLATEKRYIITLRDISQGGYYSDSLDKKLDFYQLILESTEHIVDIEYQHHKKLLQKIKDKNHIKRLIISVHDCEKDPYQRLSRFTSKGDFALDCFFYKFVYKVDDLMTLHQMIDNLKSTVKNFAFLSNGQTSLFSRVLYKSLSSKATYCAIRGHQTSENQITTDEILLYRVRELSACTMVGGIVGGEQVNRSLGLKFYNEYFHQNRHDAVYLPFPTDNPADIVDMAKASDISFYGFSITMPYKTHFAQMLGDTKDIINTWIPSTDETHLTDKFAFSIALKTLDVSRKTKIIIVGAGAMATLIAKLVSKNDIYIVSRNKEKTKNFIKKHKCIKHLAEQILQSDTCLINCTPLSDDDDLTQMYNLPPFDKFIDLSYHKNPSTFAIQCKSLGIPTVDGFDFWGLQAQDQLKFFLREIDKIKRK
jgi:3-dehydroquinate dehydratase type I